MGILQWGKRTPPPPAQPPESEKHYGLFTVSPGDVLISRPLYDVILQHLRSGTPEARVDLAKQLEDLVRGMY